MYQGRQNTTHRPVSFLLGLGILPAPYIFSWFTLREGHSTVARIVSFGWLLIIIGAFSEPEDTIINSSTTSVATSPTTSQNKQKSALPQKQSYWTISQYNDEFGDPTGDRFMAYVKYIEGTFSNSATTNSDMYANFILDLDNKISILLYEYNKDSPVLQHLYHR